MEGAPAAPAATGAAQAPCVAPARRYASHSEGLIRSARGPAACERSQMASDCSSRIPGVGCAPPPPATLEVAAAVVAPGWGVPVAAAAVVAPGWGVPVAAAAVVAPGWGVPVAAAAVVAPGWGVPVAAAAVGGTAVGGRRGGRPGGGRDRGGRPAGGDRLPGDGDVPAAFFFARQARGGLGNGGGPSWGGRGPEGDAERSAECQAAEREPAGRPGEGGGHAFLPRAAVSVPALLTQRRRAANFERRAAEKAPDAAGRLAETWRKWPSQGSRRRPRLVGDWPAAGWEIDDGERASPHQ